MTLIGSGTPKSVITGVKQLKQKQVFRGSPLVRNRLSASGGFASVMPAPPTVTVGATDSTIGDPASNNSVDRLPTELRRSNAPIFLPSGRIDYEPVQPYGLAGDVSLSPRSRGGGLTYYEFDFTGRYFVIWLNQNGVRYWLWVNEHPATAAPVSPTVTNNWQYLVVDMGSTAPAEQPWRIMLGLDGGNSNQLGNAGLIAIRHFNTDTLTPPQASNGHGQLLWVGDSIPEKAFADVQYTPTQNVSFVHGVFPFQLAWALGLWDVCQWMCMGGRGVAQANVSNGNVTYGGNVTNDLPLLVRKPSGLGTAVVFQSSTNDNTFTPAQVQAAYETEITKVLTAYPDATVMGVGSLAVPPLVFGDMTSRDLALRAALANLVTSDNFVSTAGLFSGDVAESESVRHSANDLGGNASVFAPQDQHGSFDGKGPPHPNAKGHSYIARWLAPHFANRLGISLVRDDSWTVV